ncbi:MAG TPA: VOC family protein [Candidatus Solibacter sp.]|nr:VOC family protein [Candidatus Solibacter sp.]
MSAAAAGLAIQNIGQISIIVKDVERATAFYRDVLGLKLLFTVPSMAFFDCGGVRLMLGTASSPEYDHPSSIFYFRVMDIQAGYQWLVAQGVEIISVPRLIAPMPDHDLWMTAFKDSEGNIHQLMSEVRRTAS